MEPVFLAAEEDAIPELRRFVVSDGQRVAMEETLAGAVAALGGSQVDVGAPTPDVVATDPVAATDLGALPRDALDLLDIAEERLRSGDWAGFGEALEQLRLLLRSGGGAASEPAGSG
jgi:uncharacterized membrane protein (UPF0182 family)